MRLACGCGVSEWELMGKGQNASSSSVVMHVCWGDGAIIEAGAGCKERSIWLLGWWESRLGCCRTWGVHVQSDWACRSSRGKACVHIGGEGQPAVRLGQSLLGW